MSDYFIHHPGTGTLLNLDDGINVVEVPAGEDAEEFCETPRTARQKRICLNVAEISPRPQQSLFLVRGNDVEEENQDLMVVAEDARMARDIWNNWCVNMEWQREEDDDFVGARRVDPESIRTILDDVSGTPYEGLNRGIDWGELELAA